MRVQPDLESIRVVGETLDVLMSGVFSEEDTGRMQLCVIEALTNIVKHGGLVESNADHQIDVALNVAADSVAVTIIDSGESIPAEAIEAASGLEIDPMDLLSLPENGMGLFIINDFVDELDYSTDDDGLNRLHLVKKGSV